MPVRLPILPLLLAVTPAAGVMITPEARAEPPVWSTTDTADYCAELSNRVQACHSTRPDVIRLAIRGREMCKSGLVPGGITRLRKAWLLIREAADTPCRTGGH